MVLREMGPGARFVVGPGAVATIGGHAAGLGKSALVLGGQRALAAAGTELTAGLQAGGVAWHVATGNQVAKSLAAVTALVALAAERGAEMVIGCGGGQVMDTAKGVATEAGLPLICVPTIAATNAAGTGGASIELPDGTRRAWRCMAAVIIADTTIIAQAGAAYLASGMGDALPTGPGAHAGDYGYGKRGPTATEKALADLTTALILEHGARAWRACQKGVATAAMETVLEAVLYTAGQAPFGLAGDHTLHPSTLPRCRAGILHGEEVAFGLLVNRVLAGAPAAEIGRFVAFNQSVALPTRFDDFGLAGVGWEEILTLCRRLAALPQVAGIGGARPPTAETLAEAMFEVDHLGRRAAERQAAGDQES